MNRTKDQWAAVNPDAFLEGSIVQARNVIEMMQQDIARLYRQLEADGDAASLMRRAEEAWALARDACPHRAPKDLDGPICRHSECGSVNGWCGTAYCPMWSD